MEKREARKLLMNDKARVPTSCQRASEGVISEIVSRAGAKQLQKDAL